VSKRFPRELWDDPAFHKGREWGRMEERERIIELLKEKRAKFIEMRWLAEADMVTDSIALIEGENK
jgi:hypothetical protein